MITAIKHRAKPLNSATKGKNVLTKRSGRTVTRLIPEKYDTVDWSKSAALTQDKSGWPILTAEQLFNAIHESSSKW